jgi:hypothetical protein
MVLRKMSVLNGHVEKFLGIPDQTDEYRKDERKVKREERAFLKKVEEVWGNSTGEICLVHRTAPAETDVE